MARNLTTINDKRWKYLQDIAKPYALDILEELERGNRRFLELKHLCKSQKTLTIRLYELIELEVIQTIVDKPKNKRVIVSYSLTEKGKHLLSIAKQFVKT